MKLAADSSFLVRLYLNAKGADEIERFLADDSKDSNSRQRPLAAAAGLHVWPPLDKDEKGLVRYATQQATG